MDHNHCFMVHESCLSPNSMPISYFEWKIFQIIWLKAFFLGNIWVSDLIQSSRCTTDWWLILIFSSQKMGFYFDKDLWLIRSDRFEMTNYSWISILLKSNLIFSHLDLSLTEIINSWNKRVVTFVTGDSVLHLVMNLCSVLLFESLDLRRSSSRTQLPGNGPGSNSNGNLSLIRLSSHLYSVGQSVPDFVLMHFKLADLLRTFEAQIE